MKTIQLIFFTIIALCRQAWGVPHAALAAIRQRKLQVERDDLEAERLDRLRQPSKYQGR